MPKTDAKESKFPPWSEVSKYGINTLQPGDEKQVARRLMEILKPASERVRKA